MKMTMMMTTMMMTLMRLSTSTHEAKANQRYMHHYGAMIGMRLDASEMEQAQRRQSFAANVLGRLQANCTDESQMRTNRS